MDSCAKPFKKREPCVIPGVTWDVWFVSKLPQDAINPAHGSLGASYVMFSY